MGMIALDPNGIGRKPMRTRRSVKRDRKFVDQQLVPGEIPEYSRGARTSPPGLPSLIGLNLSRELHIKSCCLDVIPGGIRCLCGIKRWQEVKVVEFPFGAL